MKIAEGNKRLIKFFVGEVMKETKGKADPKAINIIFNELLQK
jgi:aspartyl-tRNA(Asn)/glutamyl-tRNA(Gln) amidotransferase subunit B